jgi:hypothetical protein
VAVGEIQDLDGRFLTAHQDVGGARLPAELQALGDKVHPDHLSPARSSEHHHPKPDGPQPDDEDPVATRDVGPQDALVGGAEAAGHEGAVGVGQLVGEVEEGPCLG